MPNLHALQSFGFEAGYAPLATAVADNTAMATGVIDSQNCHSFVVIIATGTLADADATFAITVTHGDAANLSDTAAAPSECVLSGSDSAFDFSADATVKKVFVTPSKGAGKRYWKVTVTPSANTGAAPLAMVVVKLPYTFT